MALWDKPKTPRVRWSARATGRLLRALGITLIAVPEPLSTPVGVALIAASLLVARTHDAESRARARLILRDYVRAYRRGSPLDRFDPQCLPFTYRKTLAQSGGAGSRIGSRGYSWPDRPKTLPETVYHRFSVSSEVHDWHTDSSRSYLSGVREPRRRPSARTVDRNLRMALSYT